MQGEKEGGEARALLLTTTCVPSVRRPAKESGEDRSHGRRTASRHGVLGGSGISCCWKAECDWICQHRGHCKIFLLSKIIVSCVW